MGTIGFTGEILPTQCDCHPDKWLVAVYATMPGIDRVGVAMEMFDSEEAATKNMESVVKARAIDFLRSTGLEVDESAPVTVVHGAEAELAERRVFNEGNLNLH